MPVSQESGAKTIDQKRTAIGNLEAEQRTSSAIKQDIRNQIQRIDRRIEDLNDQINNARNSEGEVLTLKQAIQDCEQKRQKLSDEIREANTDTKIRERNRSIKEAESQRDQLHAELGGLNRQADTRAKLAIKRADVSKGEMAVRNMCVNNNNASPEPWQFLLTCIGPA